MIVVHLTVKSIPEWITLKLFNDLKLTLYKFFVHEIDKNVVSIKELKWLLINIDAIIDLANFTYEFILLSSVLLYSLVLVL